ncbi:Rv3654c family TadE-like protein [Salininema proteolyticum]|uniref:Rv3654c family TadE-like protein n=1 Tax=Salininema proteolyticum TaxID=1607685 RepID=A0ABV8TX46_9ACTN
MRSEQGSGTVLSIGVISATMVVALALISVAQARSLRHQAQVAADAAALAGAMRVLLGQDDACGSASSVASQNDATLESCSVEEATVRLRVSYSDPVLNAGVLTAEADSRAGPAFGY